MEISAIGLKMKKMEQKVSWMPQKMYFGFGLIMTMLGFREDSKEEEQEKEKEEKAKEKEKDDKDEDFSDLAPKEKVKEREKERNTLQVMRAIGLKMNGKEMIQKTGMKAIGPMEMKQHGNPKHGMNGKKVIMMIMDISKEKERQEKERKRKRKERSWTSRSRKRTR